MARLIRQTVLAWQATCVVDSFNVRFKTEYGEYIDWILEVFSAGTPNARVLLARDARFAHICLPNSISH